MKSESKIQQSCVMWFRGEYCLAHHEPKCVIFSVPNEGRNPQEQLAKIQTGLMSGVSDLVVVLPGKVLFIEMKDEVGRQKPKQLQFMDSITALGFAYYICRSPEEFKQIIKTEL